jgi:hypothetical protein
MLCRRIYTIDVRRISELGAMDEQTECDEKILVFEISDEALERAASGEQPVFTWMYCTNGYYWYDCNWPQ